MPTKPTGRPRGRPPGVKNKPKTVEQFVFDAVSNPIKAPVRPAKKAHGTGPWAGMTPEERSAYARKIRGTDSNQIAGKPKHLTNAEWAEVKQQAANEAHRIFKKMKDAGQLPDDPMAQEALQKTLTALREASTVKDTVAAARLILDFTKTKPVQKTEVTVRSAEDILDEMAEDDGD